MGGSRVVPVMYNHPMDEIKDKLSKVNGLLLTGGGTTLSKDGRFTEFTTTVCNIIDYIKELNDQGTHYPIWATCQGFELLNLCASNDPNILTPFDDEPPVPNILRFTREINTSRLFNIMPPHLAARTIMQFSTYELALESHSMGVGIDNFRNSKGLEGFYNLLAKGLDKQGKLYVAMIEAKKYPIYGT